jgi:hypothetical protein
MALALAAVATPADRMDSPAANPSAATVAEHSWSTGLELYLYLQDDDDFLMPIVRADHGSLHLEGRFQYEDRHTGSAWVGWTFSTGDAVQLEVVPMAGAVVGQTNGLAPGLEATLSWKSLELYTEAEYVFDLEGSEGDFFYDWTELTWQALPWLSLGLSAQRTRLYQSDLEIDRGVFAAVATGAAELSAYAFNLDGDSPFAIVAVSLSF